MLSVGIGYWISIGCACCISGIYFYCTMRRQRCYYDDEVEDMNRTINELQNQWTFNKNVIKIYIKFW